MIYCVKYCHCLQWLVQITINATADTDIPSVLHCKGKIISYPCKGWKLGDLYVVILHCEYVYMNRLTTDELVYAVTYLDYFT